MIKTTNYNHFHYQPGDLPGLRELVIFPDGEFKPRSDEPIPNSSVWLFGGAPYVPRILAGDAGCGIAGWTLAELEVPAAMDAIARHLKGSGALGRGNHFVDLLEGFGDAPGTQILLIHSDGKRRDRTVPRTHAAARAKIAAAEAARVELGDELLHLLNVRGTLLGNWTHNAVDETGDGHLYRKGAVAAPPGRLLVLPAHLGERVLFYRINAEDLPPLESMPHGTGRAGARGALKVDEEKAREVRELVHIPALVADASLRTEHPSCFNGFEGIRGHLGRHLIEVESLRILGYVGKI
ncbi:MAG: hypothetical protein IH621_00945 [Krumholzibacteria bacterium]|nr:hypothetical protein [Candidatus Krumholzibacteria bacterium]